MKLRDLFVRIGFDVDEKPIKRLEDGIRGLKVSLLEISGAAVAFGGTLFALARNVAGVGDHARKTAQMLGLGVEAFQELQYASSSAGLTTEEFEAAIRQLANSANDAALGMALYRRAYDMLGVSVTGASGKLKSTDQILAEVADKFSMMPDSVEKTAIANDLFGRSGAQLIPMLNQGAAGIAALRQESHDLGSVMSQEDVRASEKFNGSITRLMAVIKGIKNQIGIGLIPVLAGLVKQTQGWIMANRELIRSALAEYIKRAVSLIRFLYDAARDAVDGIKDLADAFGGLGKVVRFVTTTLMVFMSLKFLYAVGLMVQGVWGLVSAFVSLGLAAGAAKLAMAALPLLIGIGVAALLLILEDVIAYFQGRNSVTGLLIEAFEKKFPAAFKVTRAVLIAFRDALIEIWKVIKGFALVWAGIVNLDIGAIKEGLNQIYNVFATVFYNIGRTIKDTLLKAFDFISGTSAFKAVASFLGKAWDFLSWGYGPAMQPFSSTPATSPAAAATSTSTVNAPQNVNVNSPITVNVPPCTPSSEVGPRVQAGVKDAFGEILRQTYWAIAPGAEW